MSALITWFEQHSCGLGTISRGRAGSLFSPTSLHSLPAGDASVSFARAWETSFIAPLRAATGHGIGDPTGEA